jgi:hypothetical protein
MIRAHTRVRPYAAPAQGRTNREKPRRVIAIRKANKSKKTAFSTGNISLIYRNIANCKLLIHLLHPRRGAPVCAPPIISKRATDDQNAPQMIQDARPNDQGAHAGAPLRNS